MFTSNICNIMSVDKSFHFIQILIIFLWFCYFQACISTANVDTGAKLEDGHFQACISTPNVETGAKLEDGHFQASISTPTVDTAAEQEDKPGDCIL